MINVGDFRMIIDSAHRGAESGRSRTEVHRKKSRVSRPGMLVDARPGRRDVFDIDLGVAQRYRVHLDSGGDPCTAATENLPALLTELGDHVRRVEKI